MGQKEEFIYQRDTTIDDKEEVMKSKEDSIDIDWIETTKRLIIREEISIEI